MMSDLLFTLRKIFLTSAIGTTVSFPRMFHLLKLPYSRVSLSFMQQISTYISCLVSFCHAQGGGILSF